MRYLLRFASTADRPSSPVLLLSCFVFSKCDVTSWEVNWNPIWSAGHSCSSSYPISMALGTSDISVSEVYTALGISELRKCSQEPPRVLSIISSLLEEIVRRNEKTLDNAWRMKETVTIFHGMRPPAVGIRQYIDRIFRYASCSPTCFVLAHLCMERFLQKPGRYLTSLSVHRLLITSVVVAAKFIDDS